jgi:hypothetical protein
MGETTQVGDSEGRVVLPGFGDAIVVIETVSETEYRVRKIEFIEDEMPIKLSERDAMKLVEMMENSPEPNAALRRAAKRYREKYG